MASGNGKDILVPDLLEGLDAECPVEVPDLLKEFRTETEVFNDTLDELITKDGVGFEC